MLQQAEVPEDSDDDGDPDEVFGLTTMLNLTERKVNGISMHHQLSTVVINLNPKVVPLLLTGCAVCGRSEGAYSKSVREELDAQHDGAAREGPQ